MNKKIIPLIITLILWCFMAPFIGFWAGYLVGLFSKIMIGKYLVEAFALLKINIPIDKIPLLGGLFGWFYSCFLPKTNNISNRKD